MAYAPGQGYDFSALTQGMAQFGAGVGANLERRKQDGAKSVQLRKVAALYAPDRKAEFDAMGLPQLEAEIAQHSARRLMEQDQMAKDQFAQQQKVSEAQLGNLAADNTRADSYLKLQSDAQQLHQQEQARQIAEANALKAAMSKFARAYTTGAQPPLDAATLQRFSGPQGRLDFALQASPDAIAHPAIQHFFKNAMDSQDTANPKFVEDDLTGMRFVTQGRQLMPSGINPKKSEAGKAQQLRDEAGNVIEGAYLIPNPRGGFQVVKSPQAQITQAPNPITGEPGFKGTVEQFEKHNKKPAAAAEPMPVPTKISDAVVGQIYTNGRGQKARWNGKNFEPIK